MNVIAGPHASIESTTTGLALEQRIELIFDLTRRLELLDDLLCAARNRRRATDSEIHIGRGDAVVINERLVW